MDRFFTHDAASAEIRNTEDDGVKFSLDAARTVSIENPPWVEAFDTDEFHEFDVVVARPMRQTYHVDGDEFVFEKTADELRNAAWSLDNAPFPLGHPMTGAVQHVDDVHGFLRNPEYVEDYDEDGDALVERLYVPTVDEEALDHIAEHQDVSVGFFNQLDWETDAEDVDAVQREMLFDHVAGVTHGRCNGEDGCGIELDDATNIVLRVDETKNGYEFRESCSDGPCGCGLHEDDENAEQADNLDTMSDNDETPDIDLDSVVESMSLDALAERHEEVAQLQSTLDEKDSEISEKEQTIESKEDRIEVLEDAKEDLEATIDSFENGERRPKRAIVDSILDMTEKWSEDELVEMDRERLAEREEIVEDVSPSASAPSAENESSDESGGAESPQTTDSPDGSSDSGYTISMDDRSWGDD